MRHSRCYRDGVGLSRDSGKAFYWFGKAADQEDHRGQFLLGECYEQGGGVETDLERAVELYRAAAKGGCEEAEKALKRLEPRKEPPKKSKRRGLFGFFRKE